MFIVFISFYSWRNSTCDLSQIYHISWFMCAPYLEKLKPTFLPWFIKRASVHSTATLPNLNRFQ